MQVDDHEHADSHEMLRLVTHSHQGNLWKSLIYNGFIGHRQHGESPQLQVSNGRKPCTCWRNVSKGRIASPWPLSNTYGKGRAQVPQNKLPRVTIDLNIVVLYRWPQLSGCQVLLVVRGANEVPFNSAISACEKCSEWTWSLHILQQMEDAGVHWIQQIKPSSYLMYIREASTNLASGLSYRTSSWLDSVILLHIWF